MPELFLPVARMTVVWRSDVVFRKTPVSGNIRVTSGNRRVAEEEPSGVVVPAGRVVSCDVPAIVAAESVAGTGEGAD